VAAVGAGACAFWGALTAEGGRVAAVSVVDRTFVCSVPVFGGIREAKLAGTAGIRARPGAWQSLANAEVRPGGPFDGTFVWVSAGAPVPPDARSTLAIRTDLCKRASTRIPLSPNGLSGSPASPYGDTYACEVPREILLRLRAEFRGSAGLTTRRINGRPTLVTRSPLRVAQLATRTRSGKQIAYAQVLERGTARLFAGRGCYSD
jgi:hypothetical protein